MHPSQLHAPRSITCNHVNYKCYAPMHTHAHGSISIENHIHHLQSDTTRYIHLLTACCACASRCRMPNLSSFTKRLLSCWAISALFIRLCLHGNLLSAVPPGSCAIRGLAGSAGVKGVEGAPLQLPLCPLLFPCLLIFHSLQL